VTSADLFDDVEHSLKSGNIVLVPRVVIPRSVSERRLLRPEREESEVTVGHVVVLGAKQKPPHDRSIRMTEHDHCHTTYRYHKAVYHIPFRYGTHQISISNIVCRKSHTKKCHHQSIIINELINRRISLTYSKIHEKVVTIVA